MATTMINGGTQVQPNTITSGQVNSTVLVAAGTNALTGNLSAGSNKITSLATPTTSTDAANKSYVDTAVQGVSAKYSAVAATNTETLTIASGNVTSITGTTVNAVSPNVNDYVLIMNAPASTGAAGGTTLTTQPANGLYQVVNSTTNLTLSRAADMSGSNGPWGTYVFVSGGATWGGGGFIVTTPSTSAAFTYGTGNIAFTQFTGAGEVTVDATLTKIGNQLSRAALTGDVTASTGSNATTIAANAVTYAKFQQVAANSLVGNTTGSTANAAAVPASTTPGASTVALWDANLNLSANAFLMNTTSTATAAGTTTMTVASTQIQIFTGSTTQTVKLPTAGVNGGAEYTIINQSSGAVTVQSSGANTIATLPGSSVGTFTAQKTTPTAATDWTAVVVLNGKALTVNNTLALAGTDNTTFTFPGASDTVTTIAASQILTNKTISGSSNTLSNISLGSLASAAYSTTPTATTLAEWDGNRNLSANAFFSGWTTTATAAGTTTLSIGSTGIQQFTGTTTQTCLLPTASVPAGAVYLIINESTGIVTVQSSGANTIATLTGGQTGWFIANTATPTTAGGWDSVVPGSGGGTVTSASVVSANGFAGTVANATTTPAITVTTSVSGLAKGNGTALSAATSGTDYLAPGSVFSGATTISGYVVRETPSGTKNGSNTTFTLANTPVSGSEMVFFNGLLQESGTGSTADYNISGGTINMTIAPASTDAIYCSYWH